MPVTRLVKKRSDGNVINAIPFPNVQELIFWIGWN